MYTRECHLVMSLIEQPIGLSWCHLSLALFTFLSFIQPVFTKPPSCARGHVMGEGG